LILGLLWAGMAGASGQTAAAPLLRGLYRVTASTDPFFALEGGQEWFVDFGGGAEKFSGRLALTLRQNPNLRVRLLVWQFSPDSGTLRIGRGSTTSPREAIAAASWQLARGPAGALLLRRDQHQATLVPATSSD
jgi:hypothetical protein